MALRIRFAHPTASRLGFSIERLADGLFYDFGDGTFKAKPALAFADLPEDAGLYRGRFRVDVDTPPAQFLDGDYCVTIHDEPSLAFGTADVVACLAVTLHGGDDATVFPLVHLPPGTYPFAVGPIAGTFTVPAK